MTFRKRTDSNHQQIREGLRKAGWTVFDASRVGGGFPDLICSKRSKGLRLVEVKDGSKPPSERKLTPAEAKLHAQFLEAGVPVVVIERLEQIADL